MHLLYLESDEISKFDMFTEIRHYLHVRLYFPYKFPL